MGNRTTKQILLIVTWDKFTRTRFLAPAQAENLSGVADAIRDAFDWPATFGFKLEWKDTEESHWNDLNNNDSLREAIVVAEIETKQETPANCIPLHVRVIIKDAIDETSEDEESESEPSIHEPINAYEARAKTIAWIAEPPRLPAIHTAVAKVLYRSIHLATWDGKTSVDVPFTQGHGRHLNHDQPLASILTEFKDTHGYNISWFTREVFGKQFGGYTVSWDAKE